MRTIFIILDSLNRHYIPPYNKDAWVQNPLPPALRAGPGKAISYQSNTGGCDVCVLRSD